MHKYEPSAGVLDETYQRLLKLRVELREEYRKLHETQPWNMFDDEESRNQRDQHDRQVHRTDAKLDLVNDLLGPYEAEARRWHEFWEARRCAAMMRI
jgi:hypothetical protein